MSMLFNVLYEIAFVTDKGTSVTRREQSQSDKFNDAARELGCDDDAARFDERMKKLVKHKSVEKPE